MINPRLPLFVSLLLALCNATEFEYPINFDRCNDDMSCAIQKSCLTAEQSTAGANEILVEYPSNKADFAGNCEVVVQVKAISSQKFLVSIQLTVADMDHTKGIVISQFDGTNDIDQISCVPEDKPTGNAKFTLEYVGKKHRISEQGRMFCSLFVTKEDIGKLFRAGTVYENGGAKLLYYNKAGTVMPVEYDDVGEGFWKLFPDKAKCNGEKITTSDYSNDDYEFTQVDISRKEITCANGALLVKYNGQDFETPEVKCVSSKWVWTSKGAATPTKAMPSEMIDIKCIEKKYCEGCAALKFLDCDGCSKPVESTTADGCKVYKCASTGDKFAVGDLNILSPDGVSCKKKGAGSSWFLHDKNVDPTEVDDAGTTCRNKVQCKEEDLSYKCPAGGCPAGQTEPVVDIAKGSVNCTSGQLYDESDNPVHPYPNCKTTDGTWQGQGTGRHYCAVREVATDKKEAPSTGGVALYAGLGIGAVLLIGVAVVLFFYFTGKIDKLKFWEKFLGKKKAGATSRKGGKSSKKSTKSKESKSSAKKPSDSDPPEKASGKEGEAPPKDGKPAETPATPTTDIEKLQTDPNPSNPPSPGRGGAEPGAPGGPPAPPAGATGAPPKDGAAPAPKDGAAPPKDGAAPPAKAAPAGDKPLDNKTTAV